MRLIDADKLKEKLLQIQADIVNERKPSGNAKSDTWKAAYLLILNEDIKMLDKMPRVISGRDVDAIHDAYSKGYLKGREDALSEVQLMKDYCKNDCDTLKEMRKEQKMENSKMTKDELWSKVIQNLKTLDQEAQNEEFVPLITSLLVMEAYDLRVDAIHSTVKQEDKSHMWGLVYDLGCYSINGETIMYLPVYQELTTLLRKVFLF